MAVAARIIEQSAADAQLARRLAVKPARPAKSRKQKSRIALDHGPRWLVDSKSHSPSMDLVAAVTVYRAWWADVADRHSLQTSRTYRSVMARALAEMPIERLADPATIRDWLDEKRTQHAKVAWAALNDFYRFSVERGALSRNPLEQGLKRRNGTGRRVRRALEVDELVRLLVAAVYIGVGKRRWSGERVAWAIVAQYACGLRPGELVALTVNDLRLDGDAPSVYVTNTKTGHDRIVPLNQLGVVAFSNLTSGRSSGRVIEWGRTQYWNHVRRAALAAGIDPDRARPYALRHSFATHMIEIGGVHPRHVAELMGHVDMRHMWTYSTPSDQVLRGAVRSLD